jgi:hypothetical protein
MTTRPVLIFIPGAWHPPSVFNALIYNLKSFGYECIALPLIAVSDSFIPKALSAVKNLQPDIDNVHKSVLKEVEKEKDVVVVAHSWGGIIVGGALEGLGKADREETGKKGGVVKIAYMCSFVPPEGVSLIDAFGGKVPDWYDIKACNRCLPQFWLSSPNHSSGTLGMAKKSNPTILPRSTTLRSRVLGVTTACPFLCHEIFWYSKCCLEDNSVCVFDL